MWFGTDDGLNKYNGVSFEIYEHDPADTNSLSHNGINAIIEDKHKNIWIATSKGLNLYNRDKDNFIHVNYSGGNIDELRNQYISSLACDNNDIIWIGTVGNGMILYDFRNYRFYHYFYDAESLNSIGSNFINCILIDQDENVWIGTKNGLDLFNKEEKTFIHFAHDPTDPESLSNNLVSSLLLDYTGNLWIGTLGGGLDKLLNEKGKFLFKHYKHTNTRGSISNNYILSMCNDNKGNLWIGTENGGLNFHTVNSDKFTVFLADENNPYSIKSNSIWSLYQDNTCILWIGTYNKGLNIVDEKYRKFELYQRNNYTKYSLGNNDVTSFAEDSHGNIWIGTDGGGISYFNTKTREFTNTIKKTENKKSLSNNAVITMLYDKNENLWVGTWTGGIDRLTNDGVWIKNYKIEGRRGFGDNNILCLYEDKRGDIWAGTAGSGLFLYNPAYDKFTQVLDRNEETQIINTAYVPSLLEDVDNNIWVSTLYGLAKLKRSIDGGFSFSSFFHDPNQNSISSNVVTVILEDSKMNLWFGTDDRGLNLYNKNDDQFTSFQKKDGLINNTIKGVLEDSKGFLWISTNKGLSKFDPSSRVFKNFNKNEGLNSDEFYLRSCFKSSSGELFFGGNNGFNSFYPDSLNTNTFIPPVYLTDFKLFNKSVPIGSEDSPLEKCISETSEIALTYQQTSFTIEFVALNYTHSGKNQYACMLEGFDTDWNYIGTNRSVSYTNLDPGTYTFKVKGSNNDGLWNNVPTKLKITISPPYWKTVWAYITYIFVFLLILYVFIRLLMIRAKQSHILKLERIRREKDEELTKLKTQFFTNISHELRTPLSLILSPLESILSDPLLNVELKDQLFHIHRNAGKMKHLINELMDFRKLENNQLKLKVQKIEIIKFIKDVSGYFKETSTNRKIDFSIEYKKNPVDGWIDKDKLEMILLNILSNAFKFVSDNGKIKVIINVRSAFEKTNNNIQDLEVTVVDNGIGITADELPFIFDRFYQAKSMGYIRNSGTGIGLALVKSLVELHHGKVMAESIPEKETKFKFIIPISRYEYNKNELDDSPADIQGSLTENYNEEANQQNEDIDFTDNEAKSEILIIEDNDELRKYLVKELSKNFIITEAKDGQEGINSAFAIIPDLIVSDILMPCKSGIDLCKEIKKDMRTSHIPVILLTAKTTIEDQIEGVEVGADVYITKPFNIRFLNAQIKQLIDLRKKLYSLFSHDVYLMPGQIANNDIDKAFLQKTIDYIIDNLNNTQLGVAALADIFNFSRSQLYRKIKALTGKTAVEFIRIIRLKQALKLMESKEYTLSEIAYEIGFTSPSYFTRSFKEYYGKAPSEYLDN